MILNLSRGINELQSFARANKNSWIGEEIPLKLYRLNNLKLGIIGLGELVERLQGNLSVFQKIFVFLIHISSGLRRHLILKELII